MIVQEVISPQADVSLPSGPKIFLILHFHPGISAPTSNKGGMSDPRSVYAGLEPHELWRHFAALNRIPRPSRHEAAAADYVRTLAQQSGVRSATDAFGNVVVYLPASPGREAAPVTAVQAHLDMVCEKRPEIPHDFHTDPIHPRVLDGWVYATGTTLGADNGIGASAALALLTTPGLTHGPLELLFTLQEEIGLFGAAALEPELLHAQYLVNLDSEDPRELTIGCAGGGGASLRIPTPTTPADPDATAVTLRISGAKGGHSGVQIHEPLANAIQLLAHVLVAVEAAGIPLRLVSLAGGNARNAIPRDAEATVLLPESDTTRFDTAFQEVTAKVMQEWHAHEPNLRVDREAAPLAPALSVEQSRQLLHLLVEMPHGVLTMSQRFTGKVETSANLALVHLESGFFEIVTSIRSFIQTELGKVLARVRTLGLASGAEVTERESYPGWEPDAESRLLQVAETVYTDLFARTPEVQVIHAGLECGLIAAKKPGMEAISFGPRIEGAHTPEERVAIATVGDTWRLLTSLLDAVSRPQVGAQS